MVYDNQEEMDKVLGSFASNSFIKQEEEALRVFGASIAVHLKTIGSKGQPK